MSAPVVSSVHVRAHPNIALVKYWGKQAGPGNLPAVSSLSLTLDALETQTEVSLLHAPPSTTPADVIEGLDANATTRALAFVATMRAYARREGVDGALACPLRIVTHNNFPTAAGLASSASGFAALVCGLDAVWGWRQHRTRLSALAREGSGSAARSLFGGIVRMQLARPEAGGAYAQAVAPASDWPLRVLVAVVDSRAKEMGSTQGMQLTQSTSPYWPAWVSSHKNDMDEALLAVAARDFSRLAAVTESSCLKMHASMMAAQPGLLYWAPTSVALMHEVRKLRRQGLQAAFTMDAGPQVKVVCHPRDEAAIRSALTEVPGVERWVTCGLGEGPTVQEIVS